MCLGRPWFIKVTILYNYNLKLPADSVLTYGMTPLGHLLLIIAFLFYNKRENMLNNNS